MVPWVRPRVLIQPTMEGSGDTGMSTLLRLLVNEAQQLVATLPEEDAADIVSSMMQSDSVISAAMRTAILSENVLEMELDSARDLNRRVAELQTPRSAAAMAELARECRSLFALLPAEVSNELLASVQTGESPMATALRRRFISDEEMEAEVQRARSLSETLGLPAQGAWPDGLESLVEESRALIENLPKAEAAAVMRAMLEGDAPIAAALRRCFGAAPPTPRRAVGAAPAEPAAPSPETRKKRAKQAARASSLAQKRRGEMPPVRGAHSRTGALGGGVGGQSSSGSLAARSLASSQPSTLKLGLSPRTLEAHFVDALNNGIGEIAALRQELCALRASSQRSQAAVRESLADSAQWVVGAEARRLNAVQESRRARRHWAAARAAAAWVMLRVELARRRKAHLAFLEEERKRAAEAAWREKQRREQAEGDRVKKALLGDVRERIAQEREWLAEQEVQRREPLTKLVASTRELAVEALETLPRELADHEAVRQEHRRAAKASRRAVEALVDRANVLLGTHHEFIPPGLQRAPSHEAAAARRAASPSASRGAGSPDARASGAGSASPTRASRGASPAGPRSPARAPSGASASAARRPGTKQSVASSVEGRPETAGTALSAHDRWRKDDAEQAQQQASLKRLRIIIDELFTILIVGLEPREGEEEDFSVRRLAALQENILKQAALAEQLAGEAAGFRAETARLLASCAAFCDRLRAEFERDVFAAPRAAMARLRAEADDEQKEDRALLDAREAELRPLEAQWGELDTALGELHTQLAALGRENDEARRQMEEDKEMAAQLLDLKTRQLREKMRRQRELGEARRRSVVVVYNEADGIELRVLEKEKDLREQGEQRAAADAALALLKRRALRAVAGIRSDAALEREVRRQMLPGPDDERADSESAGAAPAEAAPADAAAGAREGAGDAAAAGGEVAGGGVGEGADASAAAGGEEEWVGAAVTAAEVETYVKGEVLGLTEAGASADDMRSRVNCRFAFVADARLEAWLADGGLVQRAFEKEFARVQADEDTVTEAQALKLLQMELADYGVMQEEMQGLGAAALTAMLAEVKAE